MTIYQKKPKILIQAEELIDEGKLDEALKLLSNYEQKEALSHYEKASCRQLRCRILYWQGKYKELIKFGEKINKESGGWENNLFSIDILLIMAKGLIYSSEFDKAFDLIKQGEELIKKIPQEFTKAYKQREAHLIFVKGYFYRYRRNPNDAELSLEYLEHSLTLRKELEIKHEIAESLGEMAYHQFLYRGELNRALKYAKRSLALAKESSKAYYIAVILNVIAVIYNYQGELDRSVKSHEQSLALFKELNNKPRLAGILNNLSYGYRSRGELDRALDCIEQSMVINRELGNVKFFAGNHDNLIQILIDKGDLERAQDYLHDLEQLNSQLKDKQINLWYLLDKALVLKTSLRARDRGKAEEILTQLLEDENLDFERMYIILLNLCDLLLTELRITNDQGVLDELNFYIGQLLEIAEKSHSYWVLCETYLLQAKLSLLTFNIKKAQRFLTQAHQIAERFDMAQLIAKIANEKDDLLKKLDLWKKLEEEDAPMSDRMELARLDEKIVKIIQKRPILTVQVSEEKVVISKEMKICLVCRGEVFGFSYNCKCSANYCENCARALTNLENVCWVCDVPIDYSKPVKQIEEELGEINFDKKYK